MFLSLQFVLVPAFTMLLELLRFTEIQSLQKEEHHSVQQRTREMREHSSQQLRFEIAYDLASKSIEVI